MVQTRSDSTKNLNKITHWADSHGTGDRTSAWGLGGAIGQMIHKAGTCIILSLFPVLAVYLWHINESCGGSMSEFLENIERGGLKYMVDSYPRMSMNGFYHILGFGIIQAFFQLVLPGRPFYGPVTPKGNIPVYRANGVQSYVATLAVLFGTWKLGYFNPGEVYDSMGEIVSTSNVFSLVFCGFLYLKGRFLPSSTDNGSTGSFLFDYYWGRELFPRVGQHFDIKTWTNCRMGMMSWAVLPLCYAVKQAELNDGMASNTMLVSVALMQIYVFKFFYWETGYWTSMDIAHDRAGFYLCWGCLVWVPSVYTSPAMHLVRRPHDLPLGFALALFAFGVAMIIINYDSDRQRQQFRKCEGKEMVWGRPPVKIEAVYKTGDGKTKKSLLLASGWWGLSRHFHYLPEILAAFAWSAPAGFEHATAYIYVLFLVGLLTDRAYRDEERCAAKYGRYYDQYKKLVPWKIVPFIF